MDTGNLLCNLKLGNYLKPTCCYKFCIRVNVKWEAQATLSYMYFNDFKSGIALFD